MQVLLTRRRILLAASGIGLASFAAPTGATEEAMAEAIRDLIGEAPLAPGKVKLELPSIVENGNTVPLTVSVESWNSFSREIPGKLRRINSGKTSSSGAGSAFDTSLRVVLSSGSFLGARLCAAAAVGGGGGGLSITQVTEAEPVWLAAAEFIVRNRSTRCPRPGRSKIVSLFRIIVIPAATIPTATKKTARRMINPSKRHRIGMKITPARTTTAMMISGGVNMMNSPRDSLAV